MRNPLHPSLYQINTRVWLTERSPTLGRSATLDDMPDAELDRGAEMGFDWNTPPIRFYRKLGAKLRRQWILTRLTGAPLSRLARRASRR